MGFRKPYTLKIEFDNDGVPYPSSKKRFSESDRSLTPLQIYNGDFLVIGKYALPLRFMDVKNPDKLVSFDADDTESFQGVTKARGEVTIHAGGKTPFTIREAGGLLSKLGGFLVGSKLDEEIERTFRHTPRALRGHQKK